MAKRATLAPSIQQDRVAAPSGEGQSVKLLLAPDAAAEAIGMKRGFLYKKLASGEIFSVKIGKLRLVPVKALEEYVARTMAEQGYEGGNGDHAA